MSLRPWVQASRPLAHVNIALPLFLGQAAALSTHRVFDSGWFGAAVVWGVLDHMFVIFANDYADRDADTHARTLISGGSGVIPEGKLHARAVRRAAIACATALLAWCILLAVRGRPWTPAYGVAAVLLLWLYSFSPGRFSYRGGGELLQGIGLGVCLPSLGYYLQTGQAFAPAWVLLPATVLGVSGNILTALPDVSADTAAAKRTWPVRFGLGHARRVASAGIAFASLGIFMGTPGVRIAARAVVAIVPLFFLLVSARARSVVVAAVSAGAALQLLIVGWIAAIVLSAH